MSFSWVHGWTVLCVHPVQQVQLLCLWADTRHTLRRLTADWRSFQRGEGCFLIAWSLDEWRGTSGTAWRCLSLLTAWSGTGLSLDLTTRHRSTCQPLGQWVPLPPQLCHRWATGRALGGMESRATGEGSHTSGSWSQGWNEGSEPQLWAQQTVRDKVWAWPAAVLQAVSPTWTHLVAIGVMKHTWSAAVDGHKLFRRDRHRGRGTAVVPPCSLGSVLISRA